ncbi:MAG: glycosyltransferase family 4 protein [Armatimonadetes bacterium]|nr:glycosyltransferase family 4 protein [Armatimonadota bacterium]
MQKIKILYLIPQFEAGGAEKQILLLSKYLIREYYKIIVISRRGIWTDKLIKLNIPNYNIDFRNSALKFSYLIEEIIKIIKREKPDIIHCHTFLTALLVKLALKLSGFKAPTVTTVHGWDNLNYSLRSFFLNFFTDKIIAISKSVKNNLTSNGAFKNKINLIYNGIDIEEYQADVNKTEIKRQLGFLKEDCLVGMVARLEPQKNPALFIKSAKIAASKNPNIRFILVGGGSLENQLKNLTKELSLEDKVRFLGARNDVPVLLRALDLFVLTSNWEPLGIVILEAMATGAPVIATRVDGVPELISHLENGYLVAPDNEESLAAAILNLLENPQKLNKIKESAFIKVKSFSFEKMAQETLSLYNELLNKL